MIRFVLMFAVVLVLVSPARGDITAADADFDGSGVVDFADFLLFISVFGQTVQTAPVVDSVEGDRAALLALYNSTGGYQWHFTAGGKQWPANKNWLTNKPLGEWRGVDTNKDGRVVELHLLGDNLAGAIPPELGNLSKLEHAILADNHLSGSIPPELGNLSNLQRLYLSENDLSGSIPPELGKLSNLQRLYLYDNFLSGSIPPELGNLKNLEVLYLSGNQLSGAVPSTFANLKNLESLSLEDNPDLCMPSALKDWKFYNSAGIPKCSE